VTREHTLIVITSEHGAERLSSVSMAESESR